MKKVLVVDDTKNIRMLLTTCLELEGYEVITAKSGKEALEIFKRQHLDLAFIDIKMPELSGTEVLRNIRDMRIDTLVVIMTAFATVKNAVDCTKLGAVAYLQKPFTMDKIRNLLKEIQECENKLDINYYIKNAQQHLEKNNYEETKDFLKKAISINPECEEIYSLFSVLYKKQGQHIESEGFRLVYEIFRNK